MLLVLLCCFGFVLCSFVSFLAPSHKSCGVFQVSVEGHWTYSWTYVLVLQVFLRLFNLDCRYPRDLLQPASQKKKSSGDKQDLQSANLHSHPPPLLSLFPPSLILILVFVLALSHAHSSLQSLPFLLHPSPPSRPTCICGPSSSTGGTQGG